MYNDIPTERQLVNFKTTFLYVKRHKLTGLLYFGKTIRNPLKYNGSGKYWRQHLRMHGKEHVETIWYEQFNDINDLIEFATFFSDFIEIESSNKWANLTGENGLDGGDPGYEASQKTAAALKGRKRTDESIAKQIATTLKNPIDYTKRSEKISISLMGKKLTPEHIEKIKIAQSKPENIKIRKRNFDRTGKVPWNKGLKTGPKRKVT